MPRVGESSFALTCANAAPSSLAYIVIGGSRLMQPTVVLGVNLWIDPLGVLLSGPVATNSRGKAEIAIPIPDMPGLVGARIFSQFGARGPTSPPPCPVQGVSATRALEIVVQS